MKWPIIATVVAVSCLSMTSQLAQADSDSLIGKQVADFSLQSHLGREWTLHEFDDKKLVVVTFLGTECPLAKLYGRRLAELSEKYGQAGVAFIGINANTQDSMTELKAFANRHNISFPLLKDTGNQVADAIGAQRTPEVIVLDHQRSIRYHGRIDDQYAVGVSRDKVNRQHLAEAIDELLAGKNVSVPKTDVVGCHIGRVKQREAKGDITYSNQIARIFSKRCVECHRTGEIAPFTLTSYEDVIGWEDTIVEVIEDKRMPPWFANPEHGQFHNDARLSAEEKETILKWVENGMPQGDPNDLPPPRAFTEGWRITKPDQVLHMSDVPFNVPAQGVVDYQRFVVDPGWDEDKYICAAEARPDNNAVVHHILVFVIEPGSDRRQNLGQVLVGYAPGSTPVELGDGVAMRVPAGSKLMFEMHYTPNGYEQSDRSYAGVCFTDKDKVKKLIRGRIAIENRFEIPPRDKNYVVKAEYEFHRDEMLLSMTPHMHLRGKSFQYQAIYPNGDREIVLDVPKYDFNWQLKYLLAEPKLMPKGTKMLCTATYDNSESNLANPNPNQPVRWGDQSDEEMMIGFFDTIPADKNVSRAASKNVTVDPSGTWAWTQQLGRRKLDQLLTLKLDGDRLSGELESDGEKIDIRNAAINGDEITFSVESPKLKDMVINFVGKVEADELRGESKISIDSIGKTFSVPWVACKTNSESK
jgi:peroxiredoxin